MSEFRRRLTMPVESDPNAIPAGCVRCEYLESTGTQWIDTEYIPNLSTRTSVVAQFLIDTTAVMGGYGSSYGEVVAYDVAGVNNGTWFMRAFTTGSTAKWSYDKNYHTFETDANHSYLSVDGDGEIRPRDTERVDAAVNIYLFARSTPDSSAQLHCFARIKCANFFDGDMAVKSFLPILDQEGVPCMYDIVNKQFHYNKGTGQFLYKILEQ